MPLLEPPSLEDPTRTSHELPVPIASEPIEDEENDYYGDIDGEDESSDGDDFDDFDDDDEFIDDDEAEESDDDDDDDDDDFGDEDDFSDEDDEDLG
ncbi:MAG: hypothetical protein VX727_06025 [Planctomycetota bacterium]|nr:hypothetical protein [Planctomycetota bacterium]